MITRHTIHNTYIAYVCRSKHIFNVNILSRKLFSAENLHFRVSGCWKIAIVPRRNLIKSYPEQLRRTFKCRRRRLGTIFGSISKNPKFSRFRNENFHNREMTMSHVASLRSCFLSSNFTTPQIKSPQNFK